jgi:hypothetical protein
MNQAQLTAINAITSDLHDDVANIGEEVIDGCNPVAMDLIETLIEKLRHLKRNLRKDEI